MIGEAGEQVESGLRPREGLSLSWEQKEAAEGLERMDTIARADAGRAIRRLASVKMRDLAGCSGVGGAVEFWMYCDCEDSGIRFQRDPKCGRRRGVKEDSKVRGLNH